MSLPGGKRGKDGLHSHVSERQQRLFSNVGLNILLRRLAAFSILLQPSLTLCLPVDKLSPQSRCHEQTISQWCTGRSSLSVVDCPEERTKPIEDIKAGDRVLSKPEGGGKLAASTVAESHVRLVDATLELAFSDGSRLETT
ncbi:MAG: hypothetical protein JNM34_06210 [Chthonomonadaceae bacterium]|nr:hypothetical protein [Chthonomonadaceae bacterium]